MGDNQWWGSDMSSIGVLKSPNKLVNEQEIFLNIFKNKIAIYIMYTLLKNGPNTANTISDRLNLSIIETQEMLNLLHEYKLVEYINGSYNITQIAKKRFTYGSYSLDFLIGTTLIPNPNIKNPLPNTYKIKECIGKGATSFTFRAEQVGIYVDRTLKIFLPDIITYDRLDNILKNYLA